MKSFKKSMVITVSLACLVFLLTASTYRSQIDSQTNLWTLVSPVATLLSICLADAYILIKISQITDRKVGLYYLGLASFIVISFQVIADFLYLNPAVAWHYLIFDILFNLSFCMLFIVTFKFADLYWFNLFDRIDMTR